MVKITIIAYDIITENYVKFLDIECCGDKFECSTYLDNPLPKNYTEGYLKKLFFNMIKFLEKFNRFCEISEFVQKLKKNEQATVLPLAILDIKDLRVIQHTGSYFIYPFRLKKLKKGTSGTHLHNWLISHSLKNKTLHDEYPALRKYALLLQDIETVLGKFREFEKFTLVIQGNINELIHNNSINLENILIPSSINNTMPTVD